MKDQTIRKALLLAYERCNFPTEDYSHRRAVIVLEQCLTLIEENFDIDRSYSECWDEREKRIKGE